MKSTRFAVLLVSCLLLILATGGIGTTVHAAKTTPTPTAPPVFLVPGCSNTARALRTIIQTSAIYYAPRSNATTSLSLAAGKRFFICTDFNYPGWTAFYLAPRSPILYVPLNVFAR